jgi:hypothetical protein
MIPPPTVAMRAFDFDVIWSFSDLNTRASAIAEAECYDGRV